VQLLALRPAPDWRLLKAEEPRIRGRKSDASMANQNAMVGEVLYGYREDRPEV
jgi:hypothetical protein